MLREGIGAGTTTAGTSAGINIAAHVFITERAITRRTDIVGHIAAFATIRHIIRDTAIVAPTGGGSE
jgi:hypothetical protein